MSRRSRLPLALVFVVSAGSGTFADQFDALDGPVLAKAVRASEAKPTSAATFNEISGMPSLLKESRSALFFAKTGAGNYSRLLIAPELRKHADGKGEPFPVLVVERFDTFDGANTGVRLAKGREIVLFDGFQLDLDSGQVVPAGEGGDLVYRAPGGKDARLETLDAAKLFAPKTLPVPEAGAAPQPTPGRAVVPSDFAGRYRLFSNGQWSGLLDLKVDAQGAAVGQFRSDVQGAAYVVSGQVSAETPQRIQFAIRFPRSQMDLDGYLWTEGKGALAGSATLLEKTFGFFAVREGGRIAPQGVEVKGLDTAGK